GPPAAGGAAGRCGGAGRRDRGSGRRGSRACLHDAPRTRSPTGATIVPRGVRRAWDHRDDARSAPGTANPGEEGHEHAPLGPVAVGALAPGSAARIMTGAPVPAGADLIVEVEATDADPRGAAPAEVVLTPRALPEPLRHVRG